MPNVAIVGGGIGGLTCALALDRSGIESVVLEQHDHESDVGTGIQLSPNATRLLNQLGLEMDLRFIGRSPDAMQWLDGETDDDIARIVMGNSVEEAFGAPYLQIYRPDLTRTLEAACQDSSRIQLLKGVRVKHVQTIRNRVHIRMADDQLDVDLCVGADGTHSTVRVFAGERVLHKRFGGFAFRGCIPLDRLAGDFTVADTILWLHANFHVVAYVIGSEPMLNYVVVTERQDADSQANQRRQKVAGESIAKILRGGSGRLRSLAQVAAEFDVHKWPLYQLSTTRARNSETKPIALLGDAWHTTFPFAAQGAALAIEDAMELARQLSANENGSFVERVVAYKRIREPRIRSVQRISARNRVIYHVRNPLLKRLRNILLKRGYEHTARRLFSFGAYADN